MEKEFYFENESKKKTVDGEFCTKDFEYKFC